MFKVREVLSRRFQTTQIWFWWKRYIGKKGTGTSSSETRTRLNQYTANSTSPVNILEKEINLNELEESRLTSNHDELNE